MMYQDWLAFLEGYPSPVSFLLQLASCTCTCHGVDCWFEPRANELNASDKPSQLRTTWRRLHLHPSSSLCFSVGKGPPLNADWPRDAASSHPGRVFLKMEIWIRAAPVVSSGSQFRRIVVCTEATVANIRVLGLHVNTEHKCTQARCTHRFHSAGRRRHQRSYSSFSWFSFSRACC
jgi:hypothetical protein